MADVYVLTHSNSTTLSFCLDSIYKFNYEPTIIHGYTLHDHFKKNEIVFSSFRDRILPLALETGRDIFFIEDDTIINEALPVPDSLADVSFIAYSGKRKDHIIGANIVFFRNNILKFLKNDMEKCKSQHFDMYLCKFVGRQAIEYMIYNEFNWNEKKHDSLNIDGVRFHNKVIK